MSRLGGEDAARDRPDLAAGVRHPQLNRTETLPQLDPAAAMTTKRLPADVISLCLGFNSYNAATFTSRSYASQVLGFIAAIRESHPHVPIAVITSILSLPRERSRTPSE
ncbi:hypothetical protein GCM10023063_36190 [Arthrobacter methylotrophus]|uniref:SGNH hydrolase-type esterase domain-containing protein n=1 Tax=Arthrobacter methylotrophus TaxID=121291 RepID=A0ABV5UMX7_9MICC